MSGPPTGTSRRAGVRWRDLARRGALLALAAGVAFVLLERGLALVRERQATRDAFPLTEGRLTIDDPVLATPIEIARDARGTPHIEADDELAAWFGLGFAHAQDRLAQMVWLVRSARGRAGELTGQSALAADREARVLGIGAAADREARRLEPGARRVLDAYAAGVNAWIAQITLGTVAPPLALAAAGATAEPWTAADSLAIVKLWAFGLGETVEASLLLSDLIEAFGGFGAGLWFPEFDTEAEQPAPAAQAGVRANPTVGFGIARSPGPLSPGAPHAGTTAPLFSALRGAAGISGRDVGSSAFVVAGRHSASGRPLLAVDAHLEPTTPAFFYEAHIRSGALDVAGASIPGVPVFWTGRNRSVAWGSVGAGAVTTDLFVESLDASGEQVRDGDRLVPLRQRHETIGLRRGDPITLEVRETPRGPLLAPLFDRDREPLALAWTGNEPGDGVTAFLRVAHASSAAQLRAALATHHEPVLAVVFADAEGAGGLQVAGSVPRRGQGTSFVPVPARGDGFLWKGFLPADALPQAMLGAGSDWVIAADRSTRRAGAVRGEWLWRPGVRHQRIDTLLRAAVAEHALALRDVAALQTDVFSPTASAIVDPALALAGDPALLGAEAAEVMRGLREWDGRVTADSVGAALYHTFLVRLVEDVVEARLGPDLGGRYLALPQAQPLHVLARLLAAAMREPPRDGARTPEADVERSRLIEDIRRSLRESWLWLSVHAGPTRESWTFGKLHRVTFRPLGPLALLGPPPEELGPFAVGGATDTVSCASFDLRAPFDVTLASTYRFAIDTDLLDQGLSSLAPGQSEHFGHPHLHDGIGRWLEGRPRLLVASRLLIDETARARLVLEPPRRR